MFGILHWACNDWAYSYIFFFKLGFISERKEKVCDCNWEEISLLSEKKMCNSNIKKNGIFYYHNIFTFI